MRPESILRALTEARPKYLDEAREPASARARNYRPLRRIALAAAVIVLLAATVYAGSRLIPAKVPAVELHNPGGFDMAWQEKTARRTTDDGWVFSFTQYTNKDGDDSNLCRYSFFGVNLRYRFDDAYVQAELHAGDDPNPTLVRYEDYLRDPSRYSGDNVRMDVYVPDRLTWGQGSDAQARDLAKIEAILTNNREPAELLALDPADYEFESIDRELFFGLMREALTGEPHEERTDLKYWNHQPVEILAEPEWKDGYRFQIGCLMAAGCVDELYIDVLYQTGEGCRDYIQLSDLVETGEASPEQAEAWALLQSVTEYVKEGDHFLARTDLYRDKTLAGIDFNRLLRFMTALHEAEDLSGYFERIEGPALG
jgi:hypothetical protein